MLPPNDVKWLQEQLRNPFTDEDRTCKNVDSQLSFLYMYLLSIYSRTLDIPLFQKTQHAFVTSSKAQANWILLILEDTFSLTKEIKTYTKLNDSGFIFDSNRAVYMLWFNFFLV